MLTQSVMTFPLKFRKLELLIGVVVTAPMSHSIAIGEGGSDDVDTIVALAIY